MAKYKYSSWMAAFILGLGIVGYIPVKGYNRKSRLTRRSSWRFINKTIIILRLTKIPMRSCTLQWKKREGAESSIALDTIFNGQLLKDYPNAENAQLQEVTIPNVFCKKRKSNSKVCSYILFKRQPVANAEQFSCEQQNGKTGHWYLITHYNNQFLKQRGKHCFLFYFFIPTTAVLILPDIPDRRFSWDFRMGGILTLTSSARSQAATGDMYLFVFVSQLPVFIHPYERAVASRGCIKRTGKAAILFFNGFKNSSHLKKPLVYF